MTEEEAKKKTCWQTMIPGATNRGTVVYGTIPCIGSACMAWREVHEKGATWGAKPIGGYCGLAGAL